jgi:hypothetical protein
MKALILVFCLALAPNVLLGAEKITLNVDGENYSCQKLTASFKPTLGCRCTEDGTSEVDLRLNGKEVKYWSGISAQNLLECAQFASEQDYCAQSPALLSCACVEESTEIDFRVNGKEAKYWSGNTAQSMIECERHLRAQPFCRPSFLRAPQ